jgi:hypothetical protein
LFGRGRRFNIQPGGIIGCQFDTDSIRAAAAPRYAGTMNSAATCRNDASAPWHPPGAMCIIIASAIGLVGCEGKDTTPRYEQIVGAVSRLNVDMGEVEVRIPPAQSNASARRVPCAVTKDSEVYVNDTLCSLAEVRVGDKVRIIGYEDPNPALESFVVSTLIVDRGDSRQSPPEFIRRAIESTEQQPSQP